MGFFGWIAGDDEPPERWDLRRRGWELCCGIDGCRAECRHVLICDTRRLSPAGRLRLAEADRPAWRLIMLGVEQPHERASLLSLGCAEALSAETGLQELHARTQRITDMFGMLPRWRDLGALTLDLFHRDARRGSRWLGLHPREFGLLWRLADAPGERVTRKQLLSDVWRLSHDPETNSVEVHVSRLRSKLAGAGCSDLIQTVPEGGYRLADSRPELLAHRLPQADALDTCLRELGWADAVAN
ncbi:winged helix-turn-helix domain-containing protein [Aurantiacibacter sp. MUD11]|uniref:winged helix-turn-helix domain-containing protein n=1 Tax=Aurantiacibacter sp. MUD11 TaxID=3003265 RepID=UPI0022AB3829|nr:winged helix-turn-helix domain-containing protein [Aurantiacibacter sp. MUD11]WAT19243.1 winged helix-turn-helix domain-containing protein [Aurantiacibacter sp. MUD11]